MKATIRLVVSVLFACLMLSAAVLRAGEDADLVEVTAVGIGKDSDDAQKNALKDAVQQVVGALVDSKTMVENDEVISDMILSHSGGFVKRHTILEGPTTKDGLVEIKIQAWVQRTQLASRLEAEKVVVKKVDGLSLGGEAMTRSISKTSSKEMLQELLKDYPGNSISLEVVGDPGIDESGEKVVVKVRVSIDREATEAFISRFETYLEQAAVKKHKSERTALGNFPLNKKPALQMKDYSMSAGKYGEFGKFASFGKRTGDECRVALLTRTNDDNSIALWKAYSITRETADILEAHLRAVPDLVVEVIGGDGESIDSKRCTVSYPFRQSAINKDRVFCFLPFFAFDGMDAIVVPGPMEYDVSFDNLFPDEIQDIREVKLSLQK